MRCGALLLIELGWGFVQLVGWVGGLYMQVTYASSAGHERVRHTLASFLPSYFMGTVVAGSCRRISSS